MNKKLNIVLPVRSPEKAKNRLAPFLSDSQRSQLSLLLYRRSLAFFRSEWPCTHLTVVTDSSDIALEAKEFGAFPLKDPGHGLNKAVDSATKISCSMGFSSQLIVHSDIGILDRAEFSELIDSKITPPQVVIAKAFSDGGTNAMLESPPGVISHRYGKNSSFLHQEEAFKVGADVTVLRLPGIGLDLDTKKDVKEYMRIMPNGPLIDYFERWGLTSP